VPDGYLNALRHSHWMATAVYIGVNPYTATDFGILHEMDGADTKSRGGDGKTFDATWNSHDSNIDLNNNQVGAQVGLDVVKQNGGGIGAMKENAQQAYDQIATMIRTNGCNSSGCIDVSSPLF
jgi:hypothetical protein